MVALSFALLASYASTVLASTPFAALGCLDAAPLDDTSVWQASTQKQWPSCDQDARSDGMQKCIRSNGQADETSLFLDMSSLASRSGCFVWDIQECGTDLTRVSKVEFDFDFLNCHDVWTAPLWLTPQVWKSPGWTSGEIDFIEMCPVGNASTNFAGQGPSGAEVQKMWGPGAGVGPKHFRLTFDEAGNLATQICDLNGTSCFDGAHYNGFMSSIESKHDHHFVSDVWNGHGGDGGWAGCKAKNNEGTQCMYAIMNLRVYTKDGQPLFTDGKCSALNGVGNVAAHGDLIV